MVGDVCTAQPQYDEPFSFSLATLRRIAQDLLDGEAQYKIWHDLFIALDNLKYQLTLLDSEWSQDSPSKRLNKYLVTTYNRRDVALSPIMSANNVVVDTSSTEGGAWRKEIEAALYSVRQLISKSLSPLPSYAYVPNNDPDQKKMTSLLSDLQKLGFKDVETLLALFNSQVKGSQDDNKFVLERLVQLLSKLGDDSKIAQQLTNGFIDGLWNALPHPPMTSLGKEYKYREADGSKNNIRNPNIGAAGTPYARSAKPVILQNVALPDPGTIFDSLMARGDTFEPHPNKISSMLFYQATIIIHDIFRTVRNACHDSMNDHQANT